ncbi:unnamed protein product [Rotaria socialis]|uniref:F-box domain-containing protein n=1 Tax=Rotaria socialis TaxID=392032 RepID=A0A820IX70_9BILA|nr:unnamed protein product [Rotaria socialis]CAF3437939.1 unnamed protein product [Rotaria socialis]CAF4317452.1 unnamed protein product [Rotaria socialis]CAF4399990.1 unnamed protein product [Rotaria socialis]
MNQFNRSRNEKINNPQCNFKRKKKSTTTIENLSNEFFGKVFGYLDGCDIYLAFANLNHRFQQMLNSPLVLFKINLDNWLSKEILIDIYQQMITFNKHQIFSIHSSTSLSMNRFCSSLSFDSSFNRLESLVLCESQPDIFISLLNTLSSLPCLYSLTLKMFKSSTNLADVYGITLKLPMLKYHNVLTNPSDLIVTLPVNTDQQRFSSITHLVIENHCSFNDVLRIISYTPELYRLDYTNTNSIDRNIEINLPIKLSNLKYLFVRVYGTKFDIVEMFLSKISTKLKVLSFTTRHEDITYLDANRWKEIISKYFLQLEKFYLKYYASRGNGSQTQLYRGTANQFALPFWIKRQWIFEVQRDLEFIIYSVQPYKERWDELILDQSDALCSGLSKLTFTNMHANEWRNIINIDIKRILSLTQIYHLIISVENIFVGVLIPILNSLPKLHSLKLHSLSFGDPPGMNPKDYKSFFSIRPTSKIVKAYLEKMNQRKDMFFLRVLCPDMIYLKVDWIEGERNMIPFALVHFE